MAAVLPQRQNEGTYSFASQPKVIARRRKYREEIPMDDESFNTSRYGNLMYDRRVIRGNTYALHSLPAQSQPDPLEFQKQVERRRRAIARQRAKNELRPSSPAPLEGRLFKAIQTELYLEELTDIIDESNADCQTDPFLDRPPTPLFVPAKVGMDTQTQVYEGDLFNFDLEVVPIVEVLVGKTMEQALLEVMEEEELANIRAQQYAFEELRQAELVEVQRLMDRDRRLREEKERRRKQCIEAADREQQVADKVAAQAFAKAYLADLEPSVFNQLADFGYFYDPVEHDIEVGFLPWLMSEIDEEVDLENRARLLLDLMVREVVTERHHEYRQLDLLDEQRALSQGSTGADLQVPALESEVAPAEGDDVTAGESENPKLEVEAEQDQEESQPATEAVEESEEQPTVGEEVDGDKPEDEPDTTTEATEES